MSADSSRRTRLPLARSARSMKSDRQAMPAPANARPRSVSPLEAPISGSTTKVLPPSWRSGQRFKVSGWVKPSSRCRRKAATSRGLPWRAR
ncbi:Uncharacterised protein [Bordetella pertussis]|nr:Uncharacterised protein [Bordetella pertussis]